MAVEGLVFVAVVAVATLAFIAAFPDAARATYVWSARAKNVVLGVFAILVALFAIQSGSLGLILVGAVGVSFIVLSLKLGGIGNLLEEGAEW